MHPFSSVAKYINNSGDGGWDCAVRLARTKRGFEHRLEFVGYLIPEAGDPEILGQIRRLPSMLDTMKALQLCARGHRDYGDEK